MTFVTLLTTQLYFVAPHWATALGSRLVRLMIAPAKVVRLAFSGQISEIWRHFRLGCLKTFSWPFFGFISCWLAFKKLFGFWTLLWPFLRWNGCFEGKYCYSIFFRQHICKIFVINAISDARIQILVIFEGC